MADEIKKEEFSTQINNSQIRKLREPDFSKEVVIDRIQLMPKPTYDMHHDMMKKTMGDKISEEEIARRINSIIIRDAVFNQAMRILVPCYEIKIEQKDIESLGQLLVKINPQLINAPKDYVEMMARRTIEKELIFVVLAKEWNIALTDEDAKKMLLDYYKATGESVRDKINDPKELEKIKNTLLEQTIANRICSMLKYKLDMDAINKHAEEDKKRAQEFFKHAQEEAAKSQQQNQTQPKPEEKK